MPVRPSILRPATIMCRLGGVGGPPELATLKLLLQTQTQCLGLQHFPHQSPRQSSITLRRRMASAYLSNHQPEAAPRTQRYYKRICISSSYSQLNPIRMQVSILSILSRSRSRQQMRRKKTIQRRSANINKDMPIIVAWAGMATMRGKQGVSGAQKLSGTVTSQSICSMTMRRVFGVDSSHETSNTESA